MNSELHFFTIINNPIFAKGVENLIYASINATATIKSINNLESFSSDLFSENKNKITTVIIYDVLKICNDALNQIFRILSDNPKVRILIITPSVTVSDVKLLFEIGVAGVVHNTVSADNFTDYINKILNGNKVLAPQFRDLIIEYFCHSRPKTEQENGKNSSFPNDILLEELTKREKEILCYICDGKSTREISEELFLSLHTVETHRRKILSKLGVKNTASMVKAAIKNKLYIL